MSYRNFVRYYVLEEGLAFIFYQNVLDLYRYVEGEDLSFEHERFLDMILHYVEKIYH